MLSAGTRGMRSVLEALNASHSSFHELLEEPCGDFEAWSTTCVDAYMEHFHIHWPVLHGPTLSLNRDPLTVSASVLMIGCWLEDPKSADELIIMVHEKLIDEMFEELVWNPVALSSRTCVSRLF